MDLDKIFNLGKWQNIQDSISKVTNMAMIIVDYKGNPVTKHSGCSEFCKIVRANKDLNKYCEKCDSRGGLEATRLNKPYIYLCHYGIVDIAIPIIIDGKYIAAIMAGQIRIDDCGNKQEFLEQILVPSKNLMIADSFENYSEYYEKLPFMKYEKIKIITEMLQSLSSYILEEALDKKLILQMYQKTIRQDLDSEEFALYTRKNIENVKRKISNAIINSYNKEQKDITKISNRLKPAIDYIFKNKSENITAESMAKLCHISPSYFSRLFLKEIKENFSAYVSKLKIEWAKKMLEETEKTVSEISDELGFSECGYFIRTFKKYEGVTPLVYRRYFSNNKIGRAHV